jgi:hypothetical protein
VDKSRQAIESSMTNETTEVTEKSSVSSRKQMKGQSLGRCKIDSLAEDEVIFGEKGIVQLEGTERGE